jgi:hypothetical protein
VAIGANAINAIKNDFNSRGNRVFTITTAYTNDPVATDQGSFIRGRGFIVKVNKVDGDGLFDIFIFPIACGGFDLGGVRFCVAFKVGGGTLLGILPQHPGYHFYQ